LGRIDIDHMVDHNATFKNKKYYCVNIKKKNKKYKPGMANLLISV
jgi:hypothetical protein